MKLIVAKESNHLARMAAGFLIGQLKENPKLRLGLSAGESPIQTYFEFVKQIFKENISVGELHCFQLDEYAGMSPKDPRSFTEYVQRNVAAPLHLKPSQLTLWQADGSDRNAACMAFEKAIQEKGGIDCQIVGLGVNGHIGFNEPGSVKTSRCREVKLSYKTLENNAPYLKGGVEPIHALTMGIANILEAKTILMLVVGEKKAKCLQRFLKEKETQEFPASFLKGHPHLTILTEPSCVGDL